MYDIIGDIHGHYDELIALLKKLGYKENEYGWYHPENRKVFFLGDYIDRGNGIFKVLRLVRKMVKASNALAIMGNHEFNILAYHTQDENGKYCRAHSAKNKKQIKETLAEAEQNPEEWQSHLAWMMDLPLFFNNEDFRAVHACWDNNVIDQLKKLLNGDKLRNKQDIINASNHKHPLHLAIEITLKGREMKLPNGISFLDKGDHKRTVSRVKWWEKPTGCDMRSYCLVDIPELENIEVPPHYNYYKPNEKPVFFGHYWLTGKPELQKPNVCCLDYSVGKGGELVAYRWDGTQELNENNFRIVYNQNK